MTIWNKIRTGQWISWTYLLMLVFNLLYNSLIYYSGQWMGTHTKAWNIEISLDNQIPVIPWFVGIYFSFFLFCAVNFLLIGYYGKKKACLFLCAELLAKTVCGIFYLCFPTTNLRPEIVGTGFLEPDACGTVSDGCSSEPVSIDSLYGQLVLRGGTSEYPESTALVYDDHLDLGCGNLCIHIIYKTARDSGCGSRDCTRGTQLSMCDPLEKNRTVSSVDGEKTDMKNKKKIIGNGIFLFLVLGLTLYGVFHGEDLGLIWENVKKADNRYLFPAVICVIFFIWGESIIIHYLLYTLQIRLKKWKCFLISSVGFFFSCITPSASGGQPMQMVYLKKEKIPISVSSVVLMIVTITYKLVLVMLGLFVLFFQPRITDTYMQNVMPVMWLGLWLNVFCVTFMLLLTFHPQLMRQILIKGHEVLVKMHILKKKTSRLEKLEGAMVEYQKTAEYLKNHPGVVGIVFLITCLQRVALFFVTYFVYRSFGLHQYSMYDIVILQGMISVAVDMLPLPGGMGISEKLFSMLFTGIFGQVKVLAGLILSRGLSYYTELLISAVMTVAAQLFLGNEKEHREKIGEKLKTIQEKGKGYERKRGNS